MTDQNKKNIPPKKATDVAKLLAQSPVSDVLRTQLGTADLSAATKTLRDISTMSKTIQETLKGIDLPSIRLASESLKAATNFKLPQVQIPMVKLDIPRIGLPKALSPSSDGKEAENTTRAHTVIRHEATEIASPIDLGRLVRNARETRKLSQQEFADLAGVGRRFISELENGKATLEFQKVLKVAHAAGISILAQSR